MCRKEEKGLTDASEFDTERGFFFFLMFIFERECERGRGRERELQNLKQVPGPEP